MKLVTLDGRIGKDAEVGKTINGKPYVRFSLANTSYSGKEEKTEWFEITSYDPYIVDNKAKYLTKGRFVSVVGDFKVEVKTKNGKLYLNYYVTAINIDTPSVGNKKESDNEDVSVGELKFNSEKTTKPETITIQETKVEVAPSFVGNLDSDEDDLPF